LRIAGCRITADRLPPVQTQLRSLHLNDNPLGDAVAVLFAETPWPELYSLGLRATGIGEEGLRRLVRAGGLGELLELTLAHNNLNAPAAEILASAPWARSLRRLDLRWNQLTEASVARLRSAGDFPSLVRLELEGNPIPTGG